MQPLWGHSEASDLSWPASTMWVGGQFAAWTLDDEFEAPGRVPQSSDDFIGRFVGSGFGQHHGSVRYCFNNPPSRQDPYRTPSQP
jgi:hypothetical protein